MWGVEWNFEDEDALRDTVRAVEEYCRWETTGEHYFIKLRAGLEPNIALADQIVQGLDGVLRDPSLYGIDLDEELRRHVLGQLQKYLGIRQVEGGPGTINAETWQR